MSRVRPKGLKYKIKVKNKSWFKKGFKPWNYGNSFPYLDKSKGYFMISFQGRGLPYHRFLMENKLHRRLLLEEVIHHINYDVLDNRIENLQLFKSKSEHLIYHWKTTRRKNG